MSQARHIGKVVVTFDQPSADVRVSMERPFGSMGQAPTSAHRRLTRFWVSRRRLDEPLWGWQHRVVVPLGKVDPEGKATD